MTKYLSAFLIFFIMSGCKKPENVLNAYSHQVILKRATKIIIERQKEVDGEYGKTLKKDGKVYIVKNKMQLEKFSKLFKNGKLTSYCCCPSGNYIISFYHHDEFYGLYGLDTIQFKDSVRIYDIGYQYSYIIEKNIWKDYLNEISMNK